MDELFNLYVEANKEKPEKNFPCFSDCEEIIHSCSYWNSHSSFVPTKDTIIVYSDAIKTISSNNQCTLTPKYKFGDGATTVKNLPFVDNPKREFERRYFPYYKEEKSDTIKFK